MDISLIKSALKDKKPTFLDCTHESSIVIPIIKVDNKPHILFEVRASSLSRQPGEICFPGGKVEQLETPLDCAVRETVEELNIDKNNIEIISKLACLTTISNMTIHCYCGILNNTEINLIDFNKDEVASVFAVPIKDLLSQKPIKSEMQVDLTPSKDFPFHLIEGGKSYNWQTGTYSVYFYRYKDYVIWGITAKILKNFLDKLKPIL